MPKTPKHPEKVVRPFVYTNDPLVMDLIQTFAKRSDQGIDKYGKTMIEADKPIEDWLKDVQEELWDSLVYIEKVKRILRNLNIK